MSESIPLVDGVSKSLELARPYLGRVVSVAIDQAYGTTYKGALYTSNYGYVPNTIAPDGMGLDAYVLGPTEPLAEASGKCIAIIHRLDDDDDKLILVPDGIDMSDEAIEQAVHFREQFFRHEIVRS
ncbi:MAG: inorganic diphosphatase [bacterium]